MLQIRMMYNSVGSVIRGVKGYAEQREQQKMAASVSVVDDACRTYYYYHNPVYVWVYLLLSDM